MKADLQGFVKEETGKFSATRLAFVAWSLIVLVMWAIVSYQQGELAEINNSIVSILGVFMSGKVVQRFGEKDKNGSKEEGAAQGA